MMKGSEIDAAENQLKSANLLSKYLNLYDEAILLSTSSITLLKLHFQSCLIACKNIVDKNSNTKYYLSTNFCGTESNEENIETSDSQNSINNNEIDNNFSEDDNQIKEKGEEDDNDNNDNNDNENSNISQEINNETTLSQGSIINEKNLQTAPFDSVDLSVSVSVIDLEDPTSSDPSTAPLNPSLNTSNDAGDAGDATTTTTDMNDLNSTDINDKQNSNSLNKESDSNPAHITKVLYIYYQNAFYLTI